MTQLNDLEQITSKFQDLISTSVTCKKLNQILTSLWLQQSMIVFYPEINKDAHGIFWKTFWKTRSLLHFCSKQPEPNSSAIFLFSGSFYDSWLQMKNNCSQFLKFIFKELQGISFYFVYGHNDLVKQHSNSVPATQEVRGSTIKQPLNGKFLK